MFSHDFLFVGFSVGDQSACIVLRSVGCVWVGYRYGWTFEGEEAEDSHDAMATIVGLDISIWVRYEDDICTVRDYLVGTQCVHFLSGICCRHDEKTRKE